MKKYIISIVIGFVLIGTGIAFLAVEAMEYKYVDTLPTNVIPAVKTVEYNFNNDLYISAYFDNVEYITSPDIEEGKVKLEISYYNGIYDITTSKVTEETDEVIRFYKNDKVESIKYFYDLFITALKDKKVYNYELLDNVTAKVYVNAKDINKVKSYNDYTSNDFTIEDDTVICSPALEEIARDSDYVYYLSCMKSNTMFLVYEDGTRITLRNALDTDKVTIYELIDKGLQVYKEDNNGSL